MKAQCDDNEILPDNHPISEYCDALALTLDSGSRRVYVVGNGIICNKRLVDRSKGLRYTVRPGEHGHSIPHFHVECSDGTSGSFSIDSCEYLSGNLKREKTTDVKSWYSYNKDNLISDWYRLRPG